MNSVQQYWSDIEYVLGARLYNIIVILFYIRDVAWKNINIEYQYYIKK